LKQELQTITAKNVSLESHIQEFEEKLLEYELMVERIDQKPSTGKSFQEKNYDLPRDTSEKMKAPPSSAKVQ